MLLSGFSEPGDAGLRRAGGAIQVQGGTERAEIPHLAGEREAGHDAAEAPGGAEDGLVGEVAVRVVQAVAAAADVQPRVLDIGPDIAGAAADIGHEAVGPDAEARQVEVEQHVAHHAVVAEIAAAPDPARGAGDAVDLALAVVALGLHPQAVAEAPAKRAEAHEAEILVMDAEAARRAVVPQVHARASADIGTAHRLRPRRQGQRKRQARGEAGEAKRHRLLTPVGTSGPGTLACPGELQLSFAAGCPLAQLSQCTLRARE